ncbi:MULTISPECIES: CpaF/VirB11 family protein [unclassified Enterococcus]|uniref:CpaF/VirB11 family protein n=1 Tax=unclassified Enterococcus TaxID=2608891 RepID=UPI0015571A23|nr:MULTISPECIES: CpaF/VirB11 family protein [unclassified Enterococcus]MBS7576490.1 CpaF family protein [Enterococcus sp. MMGLQ5-2]MBS7583722.1 CpaF family protein [Enterococcus sp. MMGLQ5-1]NPD11583.1 CpaF family protein [Enterococcus sp. MMGLQ5-1]NPD36327.1 CpaF family protein [Enterococcus sp. MMGLQ5-2]
MALFNSRQTSDSAEVMAFINEETEFDDIEEATEAAITRNNNFRADLIEVSSKNRRQASNIGVMKLVSDEIINFIYEDLIAHYANLVIKALNDQSAREALREVINRQHQRYIKGDLEKVDYILSECIGTGFIERLLQVPEITDIGWNGHFLTVDTPNKHLNYSAKELGLTNVENYINRVAAKFSNAVGKAFNESHPILDSAYDNVRLNAIHHSLSPVGTTLSLRVVREKLAITAENFSDCFAPTFVLNFLADIMRTGCNLVISGMTGSGKTEIQKLAFSFVDDTEKIITIEDVQEMHLKKLYPNKDIYSWNINEKIGIDELVRASLRNNPDWVVVSETRGAEAYEMYQALMSGHYIVTTLHAESAAKIPRRFIGMCLSKYKLDEKLLMSDLVSTFDFGFHVKRVTYKGVTLRYLEEIVEFGINQEITLFKQSFRNGKFYISTGNQLSSDFLGRMAEKGLAKFNFPINHETLIEKPIIEDIELSEGLPLQNRLKQAVAKKIIGGEGIEII